VPIPIGRIIFRLVAGLVLAAGALMAISLMPVEVAIGPCLRDWTNPASWLPRRSPLRSTMVPLGSGLVKVCYGSPSAGGRTVFGVLVPWDRYWRLGANEPTRLYTNVRIEVAGILVGPGRYSLYALPGVQSWAIAVNRSTFHWGTDFSERVLGQEVGRAIVAPTRTADFVEGMRLILRPTGRPDLATLVMEWEQTRLDLPILVK
jgi:hypothetical protein